MTARSPDLAPRANFGKFHCTLIARRFGRWIEKTESRQFLRATSLFNCQCTLDLFHSVRYGGWLDQGNIEPKIPVGTLVNLFKANGFFVADPARLSGCDESQI